MNRRSFLQIIGLSPAGITNPAKQEQPKIPNPLYKNLHPDRLDRIPERIYAEQWKDQNKRRAGVNDGFTYLEWILCPSKQRIPAPVSERDAQVAAAVVQWLGTCCGLGFMQSCEIRIGKERKKERGLKFGS